MTPGQGIPAGCVARRSNVPDILAPRALPSGRRARFMPRSAVRTLGLETLLRIAEGRHQPVPRIEERGGIRRHGQREPAREWDSSRASLSHGHAEGLLKAGQRLAERRPQASPGALGSRPLARGPPPPRSEPQLRASRTDRCRLASLTSGHPVSQPALHIQLALDALGQRRADGSSPHPPAVRAASRWTCPARTPASGPSANRPAAAGHRDVVEFLGVLKDRPVTYRATGTRAISSKPHQPSRRLG